jgi:haloalkane dehalogenase
LGRSGKPDVPYRFADHARYLDAWFDALGLDGIVHVGHDWGGVLDENFFMEVSLRATTLTRLGDADLEAYREPYPSREEPVSAAGVAARAPDRGRAGGRGRPDRGVRRVAGEQRGGAKLLLTFDGSETLMIGRATVAWCAEHIAALEIESCGAAAHLAPEDQPAAIAAAITAWADRHKLRTARGPGG